MVNEKGLFAINNVAATKMFEILSSHVDFFHVVRKLFKVHASRELKYIGIINQRPCNAKKNLGHFSKFGNGTKMRTYFCFKSLM